MGYYRDPFAAHAVAQVLRSHMHTADVSIAEFAQRAGIRDEAQAYRMITGTKHFPLELVKPTAAILGIDEGKLGYLTLRIYFSENGMDIDFEAISHYARSLRRLDGASAPEGEQRKGKKKKEAKREKREMKKGHKKSSTGS